MTEKPKELPATVLDRDALTWTLSTPNGRKVIWGLLGFTGLYQNPRVVGDNEATHFNCGGLNVGLMLFADCMTVSPDLTAMMIKEQGNDDNSSSTGNDSGNSGNSGNPRDDADQSSFGFDRYTGNIRD